ncbi:MAG: tryptophan-rich sensory protein [Chloroflexota bacterium]|nr:tryptophan-rich sensory protein [Chloroflexota bacterium]
MRNLLVALAASFAPAAIGAPFTAPSYYRRLRKPAWSPPSALFGPVWSALYLLIGISAWLVARRGDEPSGAMRLWWTQLALNAAWTPLFFGLRSPGVALAEIVATWAAIAATVVAFFRHRPLAAALLLPYLAWVTFATALNFEIWRRN